MQICFQASEVVRLGVPSKRVSIQSYLQETQRIVGVIADPSLTEQLSSDLFRLRMQSLRFLNLYQFQPIVLLKIWCDSQNTVHIHSADCQLRGLESFMDRFKLQLNGTLSPNTEDKLVYLQGQANLSVHVHLPPPLSFSPKKLLKVTGDRLLREILIRIKRQIVQQLLHDYQTWADSALMLTSR